MRFKKPSSILTYAMLYVNQYRKTRDSNTDELIFVAGDVRDVHVVGRWGDIFLLAIAG